MSELPKSVDGSLTELQKRLAARLSLAEKLEKLIHDDLSIEERLELGRFLDELYEIHQGSDES